MNYPPDLISSALKMLIVLGILLGGLVIALYFTKKIMRRTGQSNGKMIKVLANSYVGVKKSISLVEVPGSVLVLGITNDNINLLAKIDDVEIVDKVTRPGNDKMSWSFSDHIQKISSRYKREKN